MIRFYQWTFRMDHPSALLYNHRSRLRIYKIASWLYNMNAHWTADITFSAHDVHPEYYSARMLKVKLCFCRSLCCLYQSIIKQISNSIRSTCLWNSIHQVLSKAKYWKSNDIIVYKCKKSNGSKRGCRKSAKVTYDWGRRTLVLIKIIWFEKCKFHFVFYMYMFLLHIHVLLISVYVSYKHLCFLQILAQMAS